MTEERIRPLSRVHNPIELDSVKSAKNSHNGTRGFDIIWEAMQHYSNSQRFREDRERNKKYTYGRQWDDIIIDENGMKMKEEDYIKSQGNVPLKNNPKTRSQCPWRLSLPVKRTNLRSKGFRRKETWRDNEHHPSVQPATEQSR